MFQVTFDGPNKLININSGVTELDVKINLYSDWKNWVASGTNSKYLPAFSAIGGDPITETLSVGATFFLENGWRIKPPEEEATIVVIGNLYVREGGDPFVTTSGAYNSHISYRTSNLVDTVSTANLSQVLNEISQKLDDTQALVLIG